MVFVEEEVDVVESREARADGESRGGVGREWADVDVDVVVVGCMVWVGGCAFV